MTSPLTWPSELTPALAEVLGIPNFQCASIADSFRAAGHEIPRRSESEQAFVIHRFAALALIHGNRWRIEAGKDIQAAIEKARATKEPQQ